MMKKEKNKKQIYQFIFELKANQSTHIETISSLEEKKEQIKNFFNINNMPVKPIEDAKIFMTEVEPFVSYPIKKVGFLIFRLEIDGSTLNAVTHKIRRNISDILCFRCIKVDKRLELPDIVM